jgi:hypothetical protein
MVCLSVRVLFVRFVGITHQLAKELHVSVKSEHPIVVASCMSCHAVMWALSWVCFGTELRILREECMAVFVLLGWLMCLPRSSTACLHAF